MQHAIWRLGRADDQRSFSNSAQPRTSLWGLAQLPGGKRADALPCLIAATASARPPLLVEASAASAAGLEEHFSPGVALCVSLLGLVRQPAPGTRSPARTQSRCTACMCERVTRRCLSGHVRLQGVRRSWRRYAVCDRVQSCRRNRPRHWLQHRVPKVPGPKPCPPALCSHPARQQTLPSCREWGFELLEATPEMEPNGRGKVLLCCRNTAMAASAG